MLQEERTKYGCGNNQENAGSKPRPGGFSGVRIAGRKLGVDLDGAY